MQLASLLFAVVVVVLALAAVRLVSGNGSLALAFKTAWRERWWLILLALAFLANWVVGRVAFSSPIELTQYDQWSLALIQGLQSSLPTDLAVPLFSLTYLALFPSLLIAVPLFLLARDQSIDIRSYCLALSITYAGLVVMHLLFHSVRPSLVPESGVAALLYSDGWWGNLSFDLISRGNSFPSGHTALVAAMVAVLFGRGRLWTILVATLALVVVGVLYLGLHWPLDVVGGAVLGVGAGLFAHRTVKAMAEGDRAVDTTVPRI